MTTPITDFTKGIDELTPRQRQVLIMIGECRPAKEIAAVLGISEKTVHFHYCSIYRKLNITSVAHAIRIACKSGLV